MERQQEALHILVIEDHPGDYKLIKEYISVIGEKVFLTQAGTFSSAKFHLSPGNNFDLILLDLSLPDSLNNDSLVKEIVNLADKSPVIILTGYSDSDYSLKTLSLGAADYLLKDELTSGNLARSISYSLERKQIENQLSESEQKYRSVFDNSPQPMWVISRRDLRFLSVNDAAVMLYGYSRNEFLQMTVRDLWTNKEEPEIEDLVEKKKHGHFNFPICHTTKDGKVIYLEVQSNPIFYDGIEARVSLLNNITAQMEAESALLLSERRFKALVQDGSDLVMVFNSKGRFSYVSPSSKCILGIPAEELLTTNFFDNIHPEDLNMVKDHICKNDSINRIQIPSYRVNSPRNGWIYLETIVTNLSQDPAVKGIVAHSRDITAFVLQEIKLKESLRRYDIVAKATSDIITDYDIHNDFMHYNTGLKKMFGYRKCEVENTGDWWHDKLHPEDRDRVNKKIAEVYSRRQAQMQIEYRFRCADGTYRHILDRSYMVKDKNGLPVRMIGSMQDITELHNYIKTIEEANRSLKEIAWTQSHIVRAPLARILALADLLQEDGEIDNLEDLLSSIVISAKELDAIIRKINEKTEGATKTFISC